MIAYLRLAVTLVVALCVSGLLLLSVAIPANAVSSETPTPAPVPTAGDSIISYYGADAWTYDDGKTAIYDGTFGADCSTGSCVLFGYAEEERAPRAEIVDGRASIELPASGTYCSQDFRSASTTTASFEGETATLTQTTHSPGLVNCPDGSRTQYIGYSSITSGTLVSGNPCFITNTCPTPEPTATPSAAAIVTPALPATPTRTLDDPGVLSVLPTAAVAATQRNALWATAMAVVLVLLLAFPTQLLNSAVDSGSERIARWSAKFATQSGTTRTRLGTLASRVTSITGWRAATIGIAVAAIISSFIDPGFGWNAASVRAFFSILVSLAIQIVAGWLLLIWLVRRTHPTATAEFEFRPLTLLIVVAAVVLTRITGFEPGIIFGLVAGVGFGALLATAERARVALIGLGFAFAVSLVAWLGYSLLSAFADGGPIIVFLTETLSALAIAGIAALPLALIPIKGMIGHTIWIWNRWIWAGSYAVGLIGFFLILMPMPFSWETVPLSLPVWIGLFVAYALGAVILWALIERPWRKEASMSSENVDGELAAATPNSTVAKEAG